MQLQVFCLFTILALNLVLDIFLLAHDVKQLSVIAKSTLNFAEVFEGCVWGRGFLYFHFFDVV